MHNFQYVRPLDHRIIDIVRKYRRPEPAEVRGPMSDALDWLYGRFRRPLPGNWYVDDGGYWCWNAHAPARDRRC